MNRYLIAKLFTIALTIVSQMLLKISANRHFDSIVKEYLNPFVIFAYSLSVVCTLLSTFALKGLSITFSAVLESLNYILIPFFSFIILKEKITKNKYIGMFIILIGFIIFNL